MNYKIKDSHISTIKSQSRAVILGRLIVFRLALKQLNVLSLVCKTKNTKPEDYRALTP